MIELKEKIGVEKSDIAHLVWSAVKAGQFLGVSVMRFEEPVLGSSTESALELLVDMLTGSFEAIISRHKKPYDTSRAKK